MANRRLRQAPRPNDADENKVDYITTRGSLDDVNDAAQSRNDKNQLMTSAKEMKLENP